MSDFNKKSLRELRIEVDSLENNLRKAETELQRISKPRYDNLLSVSYTFQNYRHRLEVTVQGLRKRYHKAKKHLSAREAYLKHMGEYRPQIINIKVCIVGWM